MEKSEIELQLNKIIEDLEPQSKYKWIPYLGSDYLSENQTKRVLIVGESTYLENVEGGYWNSLHNLQEYPTRQVNEVAIHDRGNFFKAVRKIVQVDRNVDGKSFWDNVAFINMVRVPMFNSNQRPINAQYEFGSRLLLKMLPIIKPDVVIIFSKKSSDFFRGALKASSHILEEVGNYADRKIGKKHIYHFLINKGTPDQVEFIGTHHPRSGVKVNELKSYLTLHKIL